MKAIVDRFEGDFAILELEDGYSKVPMIMLPAKVREGDVLIFQDNKWIMDYDSTRRREEQIKKLTKELWED